MHATSRGTVHAVTHLFFNTKTRECYELRSGCVVKVQFHLDTPSLQQPFGNVHSIPVLLVPGAEFEQRDLHLWRELQLPDSQFELGGENGSGRTGTAPIGISAFASQN